MAVNVMLCTLSIVALICAAWFFYEARQIRRAIGKTVREHRSPDESTGEPRGNDG